MARGARPFRMLLQGVPGMWVVAGVFLPIIAGPLVLVALLAAAPALAGPAMAALGALMILWIAGLLLLGGIWVRVGHDGVHIRRGRRARFVPFAELADAVEVEGVVLRLVLRSGQRIDLYTAREENSKQAYRRRCAALHEALRAGIASARAAAEPAGLRERAHGLLARQGAASRAPYRELAPPGDDELWATLESPAAAASERAAAAVLLRQSLGGAATPRLRIVADGAAQPALRRALRIAAEDEAPGELRRALDEVAAAEQAAAEQAAAEQAATARR
ncbi:MAG: hypothetical protein IT373_09385 [Polyangiaceae bacterium]|nr:hypothetical protein [Polyangiaceae bacterium]